MRLSRWLGVFNGVSAFNNSGMSLLDANMVLTLDASFGPY
jgi:Trk-type K+ transport system membrane component